MRRSLVGRVCGITTLVCGAVALAACSNSDSGSAFPTSPRNSALTDSSLASSTAAACPAHPAINAVSDIALLFPAGHARTQAVLDEAAIVAALALKKPAAATTVMYQLWSFTLTEFNGGALNGGTANGSTGATETLALGTALYCMVGLDPTGLTLGTGPKDSSGVTIVIFPSSNTQTVTTPNQQAGVQIPGNTLNTPVTLIISPITTPTYTFPNGPLNTPLDQYGPFYEVSIVPAQSLADSVTVAQCLPISENAPASTHLAHNVGTGIQILSFVSPTFLNCGGSAELNAPSPFELARRGDIGGAIRRLGSLAVQVVTPTAAYATGVPGIGGKAKSFSPFGGVDPTVVMTATSQTSQSGLTGSPVASPPTVKLATPNGNTPIPGVQVVFTTDGSNDLTAPGSNTQTQQVTDTTKAAGTAAVGSWILGPGADTATASGTYTIPTGVVGVTIQSSPVAFTATGSADVIPYGDSTTVNPPSYQWYLINPAVSTPPTTDTAGWTAPATSLSWPLAPAPFGSPFASASVNCALEVAADVDTLWLNNPSGTTYFLTRKAFTLPAALASGTINIGVAVDNDVRVFVDGTEITSSNGNSVDGSGFVEHGGCPTDDELTFTTPVAAAPAGGSHVLAIMARDDGNTAFSDARVYVTAPAAPHP